MVTRQVNKNIQREKVLDATVLQREIHFTHTSQIKVIELVDLLDCTHLILDELNSVLILFHSKLHDW